MTQEDKQAVKDVTAITDRIDVSRKNVSMIATEKIDRDPGQPRKAFDQDAILELAKSIEAFGFINYPTVVEDSHDRYRIVSGERRVKAAQTLNLPEIPCIILSETPEEKDLRLFQLHENLHRESLTPVEVAESMEAIREARGIKEQKDLEPVVGKDKKTISKFMQTLKITPPVREAMIARAREVKIPQNIFFDMPKLSGIQQDFVWRKIEKAPNMAEFEHAKKEICKKDKPPKSDKQHPPLNIVWAALEIANEKGTLGEWITPPAAEKLVDHYAFSREISKMAEKHGYKFKTPRTPKISKIKDNPPAKIDPSTEQPQFPTGNEASKPEASKTEASKPESKPQASKTEASKPESKPQASKTEASKPQASKTEASKTEASKPEASKPEASKPESKPQASKPQASKKGKKGKKGKK